MDKSKVTQKPTSSIGVRQLVLVGHENVPNAYQPTIRHSVKPNKDRSNHMVTITGRYPLVSQRDDKSWSLNGVVQVNLQVTALQTVIADEQTLALLDAVIEYATEKKNELKEGLFSSEE